MQTPDPPPRGKRTTVDFLAELEPCAARSLDRHLAVSREWFPHELVPWSEAQDFDGPLNGQPWRPGQSSLPAAVRDALVVNLLTEDNLPSYHREIAVRFGRDGAWGTWVHRWTAEEARHADALRGYLYASRGVDPIALERARMRHMSSGYTSDQPSVVHALAYVTVQELATREAHRNAGQIGGDLLLARLTACIAADENLHMIFYRDLCAGALALAPEEFVPALADVLCSFQMPGHDIPGFRAKAARIAAAGIYDVEVHRDHVVLPLLRRLKIMERTGLGPAGERARDRIGQHVEELHDKARRFQRVRPPLRRHGMLLPGAAAAEGPGRGGNGDAAR
ncbi:acyl-ACP desaturase [Streptomyces sp. NPDC003016]